MIKKPVIIIGLLIIAAIVLVLSINGGDESPGGVIIEVEEDEDTVGNKIEQSSEDILLDNNIPEKITNTILGIWTTDDGDIITFDVDSEYSVYIAATEAIYNGTYETDNKSYIILKNNDVEQTRNSISILEEVNEYGEEFIVMYMKSEDDELKITKQYEINETIEEQVQQQESEEIIEE